MRKELYRSFNEEIQKYRNSLVEYARRCEWDRFKTSAGRLFDYCESVEMSETGKRFFRVFSTILASLFIVLALIIKLHSGNFPELIGMKKFIVVSALVGAWFEFYFFLNYRMYMEYKTAFYNKRKERFIRSIEEDFRSTCSLR